MAVIACANPTTVSPQSPCLPNAALAVTPSDTDTFAQPVTIVVGVAGNVTCTPSNGNADVVVAAQAG